VAEFACASHRAYVYLRGGKGGGRFVAELTPLAAVRWNRIRDDISQAEAVIPTTECCELLGDIRCILHELHLERDGVPVWEGPIVRIEYEWDVVRIFAEDVLWQASRTVIKDGYDQSFPNIGNALDRMDWLLRTQVYSLYGDPWHVVPHLLPMFNPAGGEPKTSRAVHAWQLYVLTDFDNYSEHSGCDYTVVNRDIYYHDTHLARWVLPQLGDHDLSQFPRIVEYGNSLATRGIVGDGQGHAAVVYGDAPYLNQDQYGIVDWLVANNDDTASAVSDAPPTIEEIQAWETAAERAIQDRYPPPQAVIVPQNATLMPGAPWTIDMLIPTAWFPIRIERMCRTLTGWHKLHEVNVEETPDGGETIAIQSADAPKRRINLP